MSLAASSSSSAAAAAAAFRSSVRIRPRVLVPPYQAAVLAEGSQRQSRPFASATFRSGPNPETSYPADIDPGRIPRPSTSGASSSSSSSRARDRQPPKRSDRAPYTPAPRAATSSDATPLTPSAAQAYLSNLLHLPSARQFPPDLALQILTHKSYRYAHLIRYPSSTSTFASAPEIDHRDRDPGPSSVSHNARLSFLGRRALSAYLALFVHSHLRTDRGLRDVDFLRGKRLEEKLEALRHANNLGREVGGRWGVGEVMRWDRNPTGLENGDLRIKGLTVEAILGGIFTQFGSPAAHRAFHLHVLPHLSTQLRDPALVERAEITRSEVETECGGGILLP